MSTEELIAGAVGAGFAVLVWSITSLIPWIIRRRGRLHFRLGTYNAPVEVVTRGRWDEAGTTLVLDAPRFINFRVPLTIDNRAGEERWIRVDDAQLWESLPSASVEYHKGRRVKVQRAGGTLSTIGFRVESEGKPVDLIRIPAKGMATVTIVGTTTNPSIQRKPFTTWRYIWIMFELAGGKEMPFYFDARQFAAKRYLLNVEPEYPLPEHYITSQAAAHWPGW